jgi:hypothetical protein
VSSDLSRIPDWVQQGYARFVRMVELNLFESPLDGDGIRRRLAVGSSIIQEQDCAVVWRSLETRGITEAAVAHHLLLDAANARHEIPPQEAIPASKRRERGMYMVEHASALRSELEKLSGWNEDRLTGYLPVEWTPALGYHIEANARGDFLMSPAILISTLRDIENAARNWAQSLPAVYRSNDESAQRVYFARRMTHHFLSLCGSPLRVQTAALIRCLFCDSTDAAAVAKLAPLPSG